MTSRLHTDTAKIPAEETGLNAAVYLHIERDAAGHVAGFHLSSPGKFEESAIERLLAAISREGAALLKQRAA